MRAVKQRVAGDLLVEGKKAGLILRELKPPPEASNLIYLRYAFVTRGPADHIFPAFILDDWGKEIGSLQLYRWVRDNGERFPRGEIFGFEQDGRSTQAFLREIELYARYPCYAYTTADQPVNEGVLLSSILIPDDTVAAPQQIKRPDGIKPPLSAARVTWWLVPAGATDIDLYHLDAEPDPGY
jgi:hypothetical protein